MIRIGAVFTNSSNAFLFFHLSYVKTQFSTLKRLVGGKNPRGPHPFLQQKQEAQSKASDMFWVEPVCRRDQRVVVSTGIRPWSVWYWLGSGATLSSSCLHTSPPQQWAGHVTSIHRIKYLIKGNISKMLTLYRAGHQILTHWSAKFHRRRWTTSKHTSARWEELKMTENFSGVFHLTRTLSCEFTAGFTLSAFNAVTGRGSGSDCSDNRWAAALTPERGSERDTASLSPFKSGTDIMF